MSYRTFFNPSKQAPVIDISFDGIVARYKHHFQLLPNTRAGMNTTYTMADAALGAFSVFFTQHPSFLSHQNTLRKKHSSSNAQTLFQMDKIPCDTQIRNMLDPISPNVLVPLFDELYDGLHEHGYLESYRAINNNLLIAFDGTQQLSSKKISCTNCSTQKHLDGSVTYSHKVLTPVLTVPGNSRVISLAPEFILPQDGHDKQDSEHAAARRWLEQHSHKYLSKGDDITILGDDLYSHQPLCKHLLSRGMHFIFTCKPSSHATLYEWVNELSSLNKVTEVKVQRRKGKRKFLDTYRFVNKVPLRDSKDALMVNWCEIVTTNEKDDTVYHNAFVSDHLISADNVITVVSNGRARWHIENGNNNTLKTKGYHMTHNFGHGKQHLASFLLSLNILAFLCHTILYHRDPHYFAIREELTSRVAFFDGIRTLTTYMLFESWNHLMLFMMDGLELPAPNTS